MATKTLAIFFFFFLSFIHILLQTCVEASSYQYNKLFVFGDSYSDTGNNKENGTSSWHVPYGVTYPGKPTGRFSDGRVLTDFFAKLNGLKSPIPYKLRKEAADYLKYGVNMAHGGTGVFDTPELEPNMTTQIDQFQKLIHDSVYSSLDLASSLALVTVVGNDYNAFIAKNGFQGLQSFIGQLVAQITVNLKRIHGLGIKKIAVGGLQPLGCLPEITYISSFQQCNATVNTFVTLHNTLLQQSVAKLNNETSSSSFVVLDLYGSFLSILQSNSTNMRSKFENPLKPCCVGISSQYGCGSVDEAGAKKYTVCQDPATAFFWDLVHPAQAGWQAVSSALQPV